MAQGLDVRALSSAKSPPMETKNGGESVKRARGMGSRRIFSPQFKIQVLDSYRNDVDCRGNQRATARKYNIHRRQIQKWLQCEASLRTTVEESGKNDVSAADLTGSKSRKKIDPEEKAAVVTLNESAAAMARLGDAGGSDEEKDVYGTLSRRMYGLKESTLEARNLKRVAQRLYPSLQTVPSAPEVNRLGGPKYFRGDVACAFGLSPGSDETLDGNFNRIIRTDQEEPLNLKSKVRTETLPEEDSTASSVVEALSDKLTVSVGDHCESGLTLASENDGGPKSSALNVVLKCPAQNYNMGDINAQETRAGDSEKDELLCSRSVNSAESSCLASVPVPKTSSSSSSSLSSMSSSPKSPESMVGFKRRLEVDDESGPVDVHSSQLSSCGEDSPSKGAKKPKVESEQTKSFHPKRRWIEESMQEMMEEAGDQPQDLPTSFPIKQRVKMNLRSLPEERPDAEKSNKPAGILKSNFTIEKLCSPDTREPEIADSYTGRNFCALNLSPSDAFSFPPPLLISNRLVSDMAQYPLKPETYNRESQLTMSSYGSDVCSLNLPLKEERLSDSEDTEVDILSTTPIEKKSFDFSGYNFGKRRSFSVQFKLTVLDAFYNDKDCNKNQRATARKFNINRRQVQKWLSQESDLRSESSLKNGKYLGRQRVGGAETLREGDGCSKCPHHCLSKKEDLYTFDQTIEVNVKPCSDKECLSVAAAQVAAGEGGTRFPGSGHAKTDGLSFYGRTLFPNELKTGGNLYHRYLYPENNNLVYHDSILGWSHLNSSALTVPNYQCLSTWHRGFDFCQENAKIY